MEQSPYLFSNKTSPSFWRKIVLFAIFFTFTPVVLFASIFSLATLSKDNEYKPVEYYSNTINTPASGVQVYASLPSTLPSVSGQVLGADARSEIIKQYLQYYDSPLIPYAEKIVETADEYGIDYRLTTAIAQQESNLCKKIPEGSFNCWGWGIHSRGTLKFDDYEEAIDIVTKGLKDSYIDQGYITPDQIMTKYTPLSNGSWADGVYKFMQELR